MKKVQITSSTVIQQIVNSANLNISGVKLINDYPFTCVSEKLYSVVRSLGKTKDVTPCVLLIAEVDNGKMEDSIGFVGEIYELRGGSGALAYIGSYPAKVLKVRDSIVTNEELKKRVGTCVYAGKSYLALQFPSNMVIEVCFTGFYSGNCIFNMVEETEVVWDE